MRQPRSECIGRRQQTHRLAAPWEGGPAAAERDFGQLGRKGDHRWPELTVSRVSVVGSQE